MIIEMPLTESEIMNTTWEKWIYGTFFMLYTGSFEGRMSAEFYCTE